jgi:hypothetical protein
MRPAAPLLALALPICLEESAVRGRTFRPSFSSPEDVILKKMEFFQEGHSEKHLRDIVGVLKVSGNQIDRSYIEDWVSKLGLEEVWQEVLSAFG